MCTFCSRTLRGSRPAKRSGTGTAKRGVYGGAPFGCPPSVIAAALGPWSPVSLAAVVPYVKATSEYAPAPQQPRCVANCLHVKALLATNCVTAMANHSQDGACRTPESRQTITRWLQ